MEGKRSIQSIGLCEILSFGSGVEEIELQPLNVLIGPNASGKSNLIEIFRGLVLNNLPYRIKRNITEQLTQIYEGVEEVITQIDGGTVQTLIQEKGLSSPTPLVRVSDGTLRFLFLLTLLNQSELPPLICIEEPESGLHPDVIHKVAELLVEASKRTQIICSKL